MLIRVPDLGWNTTARSSATRAKGVRRRPENQRQVFLDADEIAAAHTALDGRQQPQRRRWRCGWRC